MKTNPKESAFPSRPEDNVADVGLTKREYFAVMAMQGLLSGMMSELTINKQEVIALMSVETADALINELNKE